MPSRGRATALAGDDQYRNPDAVRQQRAARKLNGRSSIEAYAPRDRLVLTGPEDRRSMSSMS